MLRHRCIGAKRASERPRAAKSVSVTNENENVTRNGAVIYSMMQGRRRDVFTDRVVRRKILAMLFLVALALAHTARAAT